MYTLKAPCWDCFKSIYNAGIKKIYYMAGDLDKRIVNWLTNENCNVEVKRLEGLIKE